MHVRTMGLMTYKRRRLSKRCLATLLNLLIKNSPIPRRLRMPMGSSRSSTTMHTRRTRMRTKTRRRLSKRYPAMQLNWLIKYSPSQGFM